MLQKLRRTFVDPTGAITLEYVFNSLIGIAVAGVLFFFIKSPQFAGILIKLITDFVTGAVGQLFNWG